MPGRNQAAGVPKDETGAFFTANVISGVSFIKPRDITKMGFGRAEKVRRGLLGVDMRDCMRARNTVRRINLRRRPLRPMRQYGWVSQRRINLPHEHLSWRGSDVQS